MVLLTEASRNLVGGKRKAEMIGVYISAELKESLEEWAKEERRSVSKLAAIILEDAIKEHKGKTEKP